MKFSKIFTPILGSGLMVAVITGAFIGTINTNAQNGGSTGGNTFTYSYQIDTCDTDASNNYLNIDLNENYASPIPQTPTLDSNDAHLNVNIANVGSGPEAFIYGILPGANTFTYSFDDTPIVFNQATLQQVQSTLPILSGQAIISDTITINATQDDCFQMANDSYFVTDNGQTTENLVLDVTNNDIIDPMAPAGNTAITQVESIAGHTIGYNGSNQVTADLDMTILSPGDTITFDYEICFTETVFALALSTSSPSCGTATVTINIQAAPDNDGVGDGTENAAPNNGDGNNDGILDSQQTEVTSLPAQNGNYVTVELQGACTQLENVYTTVESSVAVQDTDNDYPLGLVGFEAPCAGSLTVVHYWYGVDPNAAYVYRKYGPTTPGDASTTQWYDWPVTWSSETINGEYVLKATYTLTDGEFGDDTGVDGYIFDPSGPTAVAQAQSAAPTQPTTTPTVMLVRSGGIQNIAVYSLLLSIVVYGLTISITAKKK